MQYNLAFTYYRMGRFEEARAPLAKAVERWPDIFQLNALYGAVLAKLGDDSAAYRALRRAHEINPRDAANLDLLRTVTLRLAKKSAADGHAADAQRYYKEADELLNR